MKQLDDHHKQVMKQEKDRLKDRNSSFNTDTEEEVDLFTQTSMTRDDRGPNVQNVEDPNFRASVQFQSDCSPKRLLSAQDMKGKQLNIRTVGFNDKVQRGSDNSSPVRSEHPKEGEADLVIQSINDRTESSKNVTKQSKQQSSRMSVLQSHQKQLELQHQKTKVVEWMNANFDEPPTFKE